ncbi:polysialyltransferase family glycosyltransferase [Shewanella baltica]|uniref:polysialyltransferase family glycosyltransferase n=1 Tax=Shewanella baltica TaxID=62322 RepID=UPI00325F76BB
MKIAVYDVNLINHMNYIGDLIKEFRTRNVEIVAFYDEYNSKAYLYLTELGVECIQIRRISYDIITKLLIRNNISLLVHNAQRLGDTAFVCVAKTLGVKSVMIQHGMYVSNLKREPSLFFLKVIKTLRYIQYSRVVAKAINLPFLRVFKAFFSHFVMSVDYTEAIDFYHKINSSHVLVYGEFWKEYHSNNFGYEKKCLSVIGYHELLKVDLIKSKEIQPRKICYVAQTLVEDGRMEREIMTDFLRKLSKFSAKSNVSIVVKLHPRSDLTLYNENNFELTTDVIPHVYIYLGHYSSLLALCGSVSNLFLYEFVGHNIPDYYKVNSLVYDDFSQLEAALTYFFVSPTQKSSNFESVFSIGLEPPVVVDKIFALTSAEI